MSYATVSYTGDGSTRAYTIPFTYLDEDHVKVLVDGVATTAFSFLSTSVLLLDTAPANAVTVLIYRDSSRGTPIVDFQDGQILTEADLDEAFRQCLYVSQEAFDNATNAEASAALLAAADAAAASALASAASAADALVSENAANTYREQASTHAFNANGWMLTAMANATLAEGFAQDASDSADAAVVTLSTSLLKANNLSDLTDDAAARTNLGLGTMAVETAANYLTTAAAGTTYMPLAGGAFTGPVEFKGAAGGIEVFDRTAGTHLWSIYSDSGLLTVYDEAVANARMAMDGSTIAFNCDVFSFGAGFGTRITGIFGDATVSNRTMFQNAVTNGFTSMGVIPNGTSQLSQLIALNSSDPDNASYLDIRATSTAGQITCSQTGSGTALPLYIAVGGSTRLTIKTTGQTRFVNLAADPAGAEDGDVYYNTTTNKLTVRAGGAWVALH